jgi:type 1 fimbriae regulatory protein FimB
MQYLNRDETRRLLDQVHITRDRALLMTMLYRGLRASEPRLLRRRDIDLQANTITIQRLKGSNGGRYALTPQEVFSLTAWLEDPKCNQHPEGRIFPISGRQVYNVFQKYAKAAGLPEDKQHPHVLKHTIATLLLDQGYTPADVQDWIGHKSITSTMIYAQVTSERRRANAARFQPL